MCYCQGDYRGWWEDAALWNRHERIYEIRVEGGLTSAEMVTEYLLCTRASMIHGAVIPVSASL
ncbi:hypothetical protein OE88DRAFT_1655393 [Heliocybe sulcata]|uniref:Uncharacterized protein n=1 Tax=Heliocybe sulcata TaxID=5364 RepID=A0A5C3N7C3_9AGAM|nr:hypothetical protein OE88DRAFT_1655393 [Heliocybe sulcata]